MYSTVLQVVSKLVFLVSLLFGAHLLPIFGLTTVACLLAILKTWLGKNLVCKDPREANYPHVIDSPAVEIYV